MARIPKTNGHNGRASASNAKYDAHQTVLNKAYGAFADLRRELADSKTALAERTELLKGFADCADSQRAWLLLEDYFEKLSLARKDFPGQTWWPRMLAAKGKARLEEAALLFLKNGRTLPTELTPYANLQRFAEIEQAEQENEFLSHLEHWLVPPPPSHLDSPRATIRAIARTEPLEGKPHLHALAVQCHLFRPRTGEKVKTPAELVELTTRSAHERELFHAQDWDFIEWVAEHCGARESDTISLTGTDLLVWVARWGNSGRIQMLNGNRLKFLGEVGELVPDLQGEGKDLGLSWKFVRGDGKKGSTTDAIFFSGHPLFALVEDTFLLVRNAPAPELLNTLLAQGALPVTKLSARVLTQLRTRSRDGDARWKDLCRAHKAIPQFTFELTEETVRLRLLATSELDASIWQWNGHDWQPTSERDTGKPEILDDPRLQPATAWLRRLDWFTPEPGIWVGDASEAFLNALAATWQERPGQAEYFGDAAFQRLFLTPKRLRPKLLVQGSGIDWFSVSAAWEQEGMKLSPADLERLASATGRYVKLPDSGWVELDTGAVHAAHEAFAELGLDGLAPIAQKVDLMHAKQMDEEILSRFEQKAGKSLRERLSDFKGIKPAELPKGLQAEMRPYQKEGFDFLCHLTATGLGGVLADDMGLGKTLQTLSWIGWLKEEAGSRSKPALVICPASVLHNWKREANRFLPSLRVLVLESGAARHNLRKQIPENDIIVTNYALLRRDLAALQKFDFQAIVLDEAQYIKNPSAQVTQSVKQLKGKNRLALTGTPLENRLLDLWSIVDFVQPGYLGSQSDFNTNYEGKGDHPESGEQIARRRLSAKLRPIMLRRLKRQVAKDLPERIEQRRDCEMGEVQRKLYLAELRRSREQVLQTIHEQGLAKSKIHVLAALTRLRQICCHPQLVGSDSPSGKTETLFELLEQLVEEGQKVLVFSQFVQMLRLLEAECGTRSIKTHILTGETKNRQDVVNAFQADTDPSVFLLSLRAAGTGLNLTNASYVVLYDPWWNPAVEAQAIDRSHRIGQTRTVNAYRLITPGTVEEKIWELQQRKAQTIIDVLGEEGFARSLTKDDLEYLFSEE